MTVAVVHATTAAGPNDPSKQVSSDAWNAGHTITGLATVAGTGAYADLTGTPALSSWSSVASGTGPITISGLGVTSITSQTGTGTKFVVDTSPALVTPDIGVATGTSLTATGLVQAGTTIQISTDAIIARDAANVLAHRNGVSAQTLRVYRTFTDASNYERASIAHDASGVLISYEAAGTGTGARSVRISSNSAFLNVGAGAGGGNGFTFGSSVTNWWSITSSGHLIAVADNTYDIGASAATRPRHGYFAGAVVRSNTPGTFTVADENCCILTRRMSLTTTQRMTLAGTGRLALL